MESAYKKPQVNWNKNIVERDELLGLSCSFFVVYCIKWKLVHRFRNNFYTCTLESTFYAIGIVIYETLYQNTEKGRYGWEIITGKK